MKKPQLQDFKRPVYDGQDLAEWYKKYYTALETYIDALEQKLQQYHSQLQKLTCVINPHN